MLEMEKMLVRVPVLMRGLERRRPRRKEQAVAGVVGSVVQSSDS